MALHYFSYWHPWKATESKRYWSEELEISVIEPNEVDEVLGIENSGR